MNISSSKLVVGILITAVLFGAGVGIMALLTSSFGTTQVRILLTDAIVAIGSLCLMTNLNFTKTNTVSRAFGPIGSVASIVTSLLLLWYVWIEHAIFPKMLETIIIGVILTLGSAQIVIANWSSQVGINRWLGILLDLISFFLMTFLSYIVWFNVVDGHGFWRFIGVLGIIDVALMIMIPIISISTANKVSPQSNT